MKLPNGYGSITKLSGNRRRPYAVRRTINGCQKYLAYFADINDALAYLVELNKYPSVVGSDITFADAYRFEMAERRKRIASVPNNTVEEIGSGFTTAGTNVVGSGMYHNNVAPCVASYVWRRTA